MNKIILTVVFVALSTMSAKAVDFSVFSLTGGIAANSGVFGADGREENFSGQNGTVEQTDGASGVFQDSFGSQFVELGIGKYLSVGYEHTPDSISTPTVITSEGRTAQEETTQVDFNDKNTTYVKLNVPGGIYLKYGSVETDIDVKTTRNTYKDQSTDGTSMGIGYQRSFGESGFGLRFEGNYLEFDNVKTDDGETTDTVANNGRNRIFVDDMEGLEGKIAITYTFGRNN
tara:strand:+ start:286 stop:975 length:690 start_codon:yes stop_codon:yes gene_type:complete